MKDSRYRYKRKCRAPYVKPSTKTNETERGKANENENSPVIGCAGKRRFPDLISAHAAAHHMCILQKSSEAYIYLCEGCGGYHLTKAPTSPEGVLNRWAYFFGKD